MSQNRFEVDHLVGDLMVVIVEWIESLDKKRISLSEADEIVGAAIGDCLAFHLTEITKTDDHTIAELHRIMLPLLARARDISNHLDLEEARAAGQKKIAQLFPKLDS
jgi:hypothetical protein